MRWVNRTGRRALAAAALLLLAACGNYSTEDLRFLAALPTREDLRVAPPTGGTAGAATVCTNGPAKVWLDGKPTSDNLNAGVDGVLALVDVVRKLEPSHRERDARRWGPFPSDRHPGREIQVVMTRTFPSGAEDRPVHQYRFEARVVGVTGFDPVIVGSFDGASARHGRGAVVLDFQKMWDLGIADPGTGHGRMDIVYDRVTEPVTIELGFTGTDFAVEQFGYGFAGYRDGSGRFDYRLRNAVNGDVLTVTTGFDRAGAGRATVAVVTGAGATGSYSQCWDGSACLTFVRDPIGFSCPTPPCGFGDQAADCAPVPFVGPFPLP
jgi:hypothetical protein